MARDEELTRARPAPAYRLPGPHAVLDLPSAPGPARARRISPLNHEEIIGYNLRGGGNEFTEFEYAQADRIEKTRALIEQIITEQFDGKPVTIVEPGCSTGDISGYFTTKGHKAIGIDVTPGAAAAAAKKWPKMRVLNQEAEAVEPIPCDILVMCEFLEHISYPHQFIERWMPLAKTSVISHPLVGDGGDPEVGHLWAYYEQDFANWFPLGGHQAQQTWEFPMGYRMVIGWSKLT